MDAEETGRFTIPGNGIERAENAGLVETLAGRAQTAGQTGTLAKEHLNVAAHGLRGLASLMVVGAHIMGGTARHVYQHDPSYVAAVQRPWYLGTFGVELFFVISGFVILPSALKYRPAEFALRRFLRIYPIFFVFSLLFIGLNWQTNSYGYNNNIKSIASGLLFLNLFTGTEQLTPNAWSLTYEVLFYVLTCALVYSVIRRRSLALGVLATALSLWFVVTFPIAFYFIAGVATRLLLPRNRLSTPVKMAIEILSFFTMLSLASRGHYEYYFRDLSNPVVISLILATGVYFYFAASPGSLTNIVMKNRIARYFGTVSYSLYLVHPYVYYLARAIFVHERWFTTETAYSVGIFSVFVFIPSIIITHFVHMTLERTPYQWVFRQRIYSKVPKENEPDVVLATGERG